MIQTIALPQPFLRQNALQLPVPQIEGGQRPEQDRLRRQILHVHLLIIEQIILPVVKSIQRYQVDIAPFQDHTDAVPLLRRSKSQLLPLVFQGIVGRLFLPARSIILPVDLLIGCMLRRMQDNLPEPVQLLQKTLLILCGQLPQKGKGRAFLYKRHDTCVIFQFHGHHPHTMAFQISRILLKRLPLLHPFPVDRLFYHTTIPADHGEHGVLPPPVHGNGNLIYVGKPAVKRALYKECVGHGMEHPVVKQRTVQQFLLQKYRIRTMILRKNPDVQLFPRRKIIGEHDLRPLQHRKYRVEPVMQKPGFPEHLPDLRFRVTAAFPAVKSRRLRPDIPLHAVKTPPRIGIFVPAEIPDAQTIVHPQ